MTKKEKAEQQANAVAKLREMLNPGDTVYTILRHRSRSGMSRRISTVAVIGGRIADLDYLVARALDYRVHRDGGLIVGGCGMDMGFHVVYNLARVLFSAGFGCTGEESYLRRCPSNDHSNGDANYTPNGHRGPLYTPGDKSTLRHWHADGGYALRQ